MQILKHPITGANGPVTAELVSLHFGPLDQGKKVYIQAALHADEVPGMLVAQFLRAELASLEANGRLHGEIVLVPAANPLGLAQAVQGTPFGRFDLTTGINFNRGFRHVGPEITPLLVQRLGQDEAANILIVREQACQAVARWNPMTDSDSLKKILLGLAIDADIVLDLHCDNEAMVHLYTGTALANALEPLPAILGAHAVLVTSEAGQEPFDEACSRLWWEIAATYRGLFPIPSACLAATVELRGEMDVDYDTARADAAGIIQFLALKGMVGLQQAGPVVLPPAMCQPTPLEGVEPLLAPQAGILVYQRALGEDVRAGDVIADVIDPVSGSVIQVRASVAGRFFARSAHRHVLRGMNIGKISGKTAYRTGNLMSL
ncbi:succinylglutamate desuccinylase/aspartoacylase family protein [Undibacterium terreum]|uniref:Succinylglutamate desuccinylase/aspartoacylase n=1 Tax=Undibacterium terreum TaxID=1224302 RepID=A0A916UP67_9BURK|nr:succinylglutamate desuccinylase/aspartoacylase family protein [Undibacterium terreum]GGC81426.1 succinylglutamate desuccinylase/aspartoacylase [Undibacterium terreum]